MIPMFSLTFLVVGSLFVCCFVVVVVFLSLFLFLIQSATVGVIHSIIVINVGHITIVIIRNTWFYIVPFI